MKITVFPQTLWWCPPKALWQKVSSVYGLHPLGTEVQEKGFTSTARNLWQEQMRRQKQEYKASNRTGDKTIASKLPLLSLLFQLFSTKNRFNIVSNEEMFSVSKPFSMSSVNQQFDNHCNSRNPPLHWHCCVGYMSWWGHTVLQIQGLSHWPLPCAISVLAGTGATHKRFWKMLGFFETILETSWCLISLKPPGIGTAHLPGHPVMQSFCRKLHGTQLPKLAVRWLGALASPTAPSSSCGPDFLVH